MGTDPALGLATWPAQCELKGPSRAVTQTAVAYTFRSAKCGTPRLKEFPAANAHGACVAAFSDALLNGRDPVPSGIDGLRSMQLTDAMAPSAADGVHVRLAY